MACAATVYTRLPAAAGLAALEYEPHTHRRERTPVAGVVASIERRAPSFSSPKLRIHLEQQEEVVADDAAPADGGELLDAPQGFFAGKSMAYDRAEGIPP